ncbi:MAG: PaeR7I family type II restriction endonuclease [Pirellulales bacterium]|nr:PaeR7I family type II restriction endonuclease [Pirellulales bacterium]
MINKKELDKGIRKAVKSFWQVRGSQASRQGSTTGNKDQGARQAVTGGKQMAGFENLVKDLLLSAGIHSEQIICKNRLELPGYFRPEKKWDLLVLVDGNLLASVEFKSQVGPSFGNNYNNRSEEALGNATDLWTAYREGAFNLSARPWLGYLFLLEESPKSLAPVDVREPHFPVLREFRQASYAKRYEILLTKLVRERLYDAACLILTKSSAGSKSGLYSEPLKELSFQNFASSLIAKAMSYKNGT